MAIPLWCAKCGELVGIESTEDTLNRMKTGDFNSHIDLPCTGYHEAPRISERKRMLGLIKDVTADYPETGTQSTHSEYLGPRNKAWLFLAFVLGQEQWPNGTYNGLLVDGEWVWFEFGRGFYGKGIEKLS
jgi:hypothetical protein